MEAVEGGGIAPVLEFLAFGAGKFGVAPAKGHIMEDFVAWHYVAATFRQTVAPDLEVLVVRGQANFSLHIGEDQSLPVANLLFFLAGHKTSQDYKQGY